MDIAAWVTGMAAIITATGGVLLAVRSVRSKERQAAGGEIRSLSAMLEQERDARVACELRVHQLRITLARHGIADADRD